MVEMGRWSERIEKEREREITAAMDEVMSLSHGGRTVVEVEHVWLCSGRNCVSAKEGERGRYCGHMIMCGCARARVCVYVE